MTTGKTMKKKIESYDDPNHSNNSEKYHTGKKCIEMECDKPAGTAWSDFWCQKHNALRMRRITKSLNEMVKL